MPDLTELKVPTAVKTYAINSYRSSFPIVVNLTGDTSNADVNDTIARMSRELAAHGALVTAKLPQDIGANLNYYRIKRYTDVVIVVNPGGTISDDVKKEIGLGLRLDLPVYSCNTGNRFSAKPKPQKYSELVV